MLPIAANLLPAEVTEARRGRKVRVFVAGMVSFAIAATAGWYVLAGRDSSSAHDELTSSQNANDRLQRQQNTYGDLVKTESATKTIAAELQKLMAQDVQWWQYVPSIRAAAPAGVTIDSIQSSLLNSGNGGSAATVPGIATTGVIGSVTIVGGAPDKATIAAFVDALDSVKGVTNPFVTSAAVAVGNSYQFTIQLDITSVVYGGRFSAKSGAK